MASLVRKLFRRKRQPPLVCAVALDDHGHPLIDDPSHVHTDACFIEFEPLAIVELFQSQGCASCPPAVPAIQAAANGPNRLLLTYNVKLFDHNGWTDTLARNSWDQRQRAYLQRWKRKTLFTPHVVVNGILDTSSGGELNDVLQRSRTSIQGMMMSYHVVLDANDTEIRVDSDVPMPMATPMHNMSPPDLMSGGHGDGHQPMMMPTPPPPPFPVHDIMVAVYNTADQTVKIGKGANKGKKLLHRNVVTNLMKIGEWSGGNLTVALPAARSTMAHGTDVVAFLQAGSGGPIIAATKV